MLRSSIWFEKPQRDIFITALLMCEPFEVRQPMQQIAVNSLDFTGWTVPPGWYGFARAASTALCRMALVSREEGLAALDTLGAPDPESKSQPFEGRRLVRVNEGYIVLNFITYRERDYTGAERSKRWRERQKKAKPFPHESQNHKGRPMKANGKGHTHETMLDRPSD